MWHPKHVMHDMCSWEVTLDPCQKASTPDWKQVTLTCSSKSIAAIEHVGSSTFYVDIARESLYGCIAIAGYAADVTPTGASYRVHQGLGAIGPQTHEWLAIFC